MNADDIWRFFEETGDVIYYLIYKELYREEDTAAKAG